MWVFWRSDDVNPSRKYTVMVHGNDEMSDLGLGDGVSGQMIWCHFAGIVSMLLLLQTQLQFHLSFGWSFSQSARTPSQSCRGPRVRGSPSYLHHTADTTYLVIQRHCVIWKSLDEGCIALALYSLCKCFHFACGPGWFTAWFTDWTLLPNHSHACSVAGFWLYRGAATSWNSSSIIYCCPHLSTHPSAIFAGQSDDCK